MTVVIKSQSARYAARVETSTAIDGASNTGSTKTPADFGSVTLPTLVAFFIVGILLGLAITQ